MTKSLSQILDILVNMLKKEKKKAQDALYLSSMDRSELRHGQSTPFPPGNPDGPKTLPLSTPTQALDSSTSPYRSSLLHRKTGRLYLFIHTDSVIINLKI